MEEKTRRQLYERANEYRERAKTHAVAAVNWQGVAEKHAADDDAIVYELLAETQSEIADAYAAAGRKFAEAAEMGETWEAPHV